MAPPRHRTELELGDLRMLMVVFGAGASYDSVSSFPPDQGTFDDRPPLSNQLFELRGHFSEVMNRFPKCLAIIPNLQSLPANESVERVLQRFQDEASEYPERHSQLAAVRYYLHLMLWECQTMWENRAKGVSNYKSLLDQIQRWRRYGDDVCLVTFNYDTLLEAALPAVYVKIKTMTDYVDKGYKVIKLHGSVNWARRVNSNINNISNRNTWDVASELIDRAAEIDISQTYEIVEYGDRPIGRAVNNEPLFPAISIPVETKSGYECPKLHLDALQQMLPKVTKVLIIGWRASEDGFLSLLAENLEDAATMMVVASNEAAAIEIIKKVQVKIGVGGRTWLAAKGGFSSFIVNREGNQFFHQ